MIRGTTPTICYRLPFLADQLAAASIAISQNGSVVLEKTLDECVCEADTISADLSQEDTLKLDAKSMAEIQLRVRTLGGDALATEPVTTPVGKILRDGVI